MSDLPVGWSRSRLGDAATDISYGFTTASTAGGDLPKLLRITDIQNGSVNWETVPRCTDQPDERTTLGASDIVIARTGATTGKSYLINMVPEKAVFASYLIRVRLSAAVDPAYAWSFMQSRDYWSQIQTVAKGTAQPGANASILSGLSLPIAPLPEQQRIVAKIDSLTGKSRRARDHLDHIPRLVEKYKQAILAAAFRGDLCNERRSPKLQPLSEFIDSLDQGWSPKCASEPASPNDWGVIKTTAIQSVQFLPLENKRLPADLAPRPGIVINAGDVLITRAGPRSRVGISCLVTENHPKLMLCDKAYRLRINQEMADPAFVTYMLNTPQCLSELEAMKTGISDSGLNLTQSKFIALKIPAFSLQEQSEIIGRIQFAFLWIERLTGDATSARKLIDHLDQSVLAKAFKGELVPQDPADEPASVLLDRIRAERAAAPKAKRGRKKAA
ncbi:restriction endonuclease subunit S [Novosphingobium gossypii]|uniref:restriction endonuclease subunit S n=1 Tax=Novosphingobium gossypii TaxID=1604774 RepID=UPI003D1FED40